MSPNTERQYRRALAARGLLAGDATALPELATLRDVVVSALPPKTPPQQISSLARWTDTITPWLANAATPTAIYDRLRLEHAGLHGSLSAVKRLCLRLQRARGIQPEDVAIPVETAPGELAQVDVGYVGRLYDPATRGLRPAIETWLQCHAEAFAALGGVRAVLVPDNLKAAVIRAALGVAGATTLNRSYRECALHYGFQVDPTPVRSPGRRARSRPG
jgi:hypothetical protein